MNKIKNLSQSHTALPTGQSADPHCGEKARPPTHTVALMYLSPPPASIRSRQDSSGQREWLSQGTEGGQLACEGDRVRLATARWRHKDKTGKIRHLSAHTFSDVFWRTHRWCLSRFHQIPYIQLWSRRREGTRESPLVLQQDLTSSVWPEK